MMTYADLYVKEWSEAIQGGRQQGATEPGVQISGQTLEAPGSSASGICF